mgnify:CR=1 FL=1
MLTLAIDTSGADCAVHLARDGAALTQLRETLGRGHAERLAPMTQEALAQAGVKAPDIARIGVVTGPGSFAGIRVGVAFARGLALALKAPALGVSLFDLWAREYAAEPVLAAVHDSGRGEAAFRLYRKGDPAGAVMRLPYEAAAAAVREESAAPMLAGSAAQRIAEFLPGARLAPDAPADLALLARIAADADPAAFPPAPLYVRPPDAKLPGGKTPGVGG